MRHTTLGFAINPQQRWVLLGRKSRGLGVGNWNGFGGGFEPGETAEQCLAREGLEEFGISVIRSELIAFFVFRFTHKPQSNHDCAIFLIDEFEGKPKGLDDMGGHVDWFSFDILPEIKLWEGDLCWWPEIFARRKLHGEVTYNESGLYDYHHRRVEAVELNWQDE